MTAGPSRSPPGSPPPARRWARRLPGAFLTEPGRSAVTAAGLGGGSSYLGTQRLSSSEQSPWARAGRIFAGAAAVRAAGGRAPLGQGRRGSALLSARFVCCGLFACLCFPLSSLSLAPCAPGLGSPGRLCHPPGMPPPPPAAPAPAEPGEGCAPPALPAAAPPRSAPRLSAPWRDVPGGWGDPRPVGRASPPLPRARRGSGAAAGVDRARRASGAAAPAGPAGTWAAAAPTPSPAAGVAGPPAERAGSRPERPGSAGRGAAAAAALPGIALRRALLSARSPSPDTSRQEPAGEGRGRGWQRGGEPGVSHAACRGGSGRRGGERRPGVRARPAGSGRREGGMCVRVECAAWDGHGGVSGDRE